MYRGGLYGKYIVTCPLPQDHIPKYDLLFSAWLVCLKEWCVCYTKRWKAVSVCVETETSKSLQIRNERADLFTALFRQASCCNDSESYPLRKIQLCQRRAYCVISRSLMVVCRGLFLLLRPQSGNEKSHRYHIHSQ